MRKFLICGDTSYCSHNSDNFVNWPYTLLTTCGEHWPEMKILANIGKVENTVLK